MSTFALLNNAHLDTESPAANTGGMPTAKRGLWQGQSQHTKAIIALGLVSFFWGTTWIASKEGVSHMPALFMASIRQLCAGALFTIFYLIRGGVQWPTRQEWGGILWLSFLNFVLANALSTWGVQYIPPGLGSIIGAISPLWIVLFFWLGRGVKTSRKTAAGIVLGFAGICIIFYDHLADFVDPKFRLGIFLSVASTLSWAAGTLYTKRQARSFNPYFSLGLQMVISGVFIFGFTHALDAVLPQMGYAAQFTIPISSIPLEAWGAIAFLVVFGSIVAFGSYLYALQHLPVEQASIYAYINPIVAILLGAIIYSDKLTVYIIGGTLVTLYGVWLVNRGAAR